MSRTKELTLALTILTLFACSTTRPTPSSTPIVNGVDPGFSPKSKSPAFTARKPRLCFDLGHHALLGEDGRYAPVLRLLESDGHEIIRLKEFFDEKTLKGCDLLYSSAAMGYPDLNRRKLAARSAYSDEEISAIGKWVENGGGLLLMTDHRPMSDAMEKLLNRFGIRGSRTNVRNPMRQLSDAEEGGIFEIAGELLDPRHPIIQGRTPEERIEKVYFFYGQALQPPRGATSFLKPGPEAQIGGLEGAPRISTTRYSAAAVALPVKKGRVVVFGDATVFTSKYAGGLKTGINREGSDNVQLALNVFRWLYSASH